MTTTYQYESAAELAAVGPDEIDLTPRPHGELAEQLRAEREANADLAQQLANERGSHSHHVGEVERLSVALISARNELDEFKQSVVDLALRVQREMDWCDEGVARALRSIGLEPPTRTYTFRVTMTYDVTATLANPDRASDVSEGFVLRSITGVNPYGEVAMDNDWTDVDSTVADSDVTDLEPSE